MIKPKGYNTYKKKTYKKSRYRKSRKRFLYRTWLRDWIKFITWENYYEALNYLEQYNT